MLFRSSAIAVCLALAACTVGPDFQQPTVTAPNLWRPEPAQNATAGVSVITNGAVDPRWWQSFQDPELSSLVQRLATQNLDLKEAATRIQASQAQRQIAASQGLPHINEQSSYTRNRQSANGFLKLVEPQPDAPVEYDNWQNGLSASWELDLFGRVRRSVEAANADLQAQVDARRALALEALANLAQSYFQLRGVQAQLAIATRNVQLAAQGASLVQSRFGNGTATTLDTAQARAQQDDAQSVIPPLRAQQRTLINAIGLLLAQPPGALRAELERSEPSAFIPPQIPIGLPGDLVRRRPDVLQAEAQLHAATARTGVAVANFYPDITLNGMADLNGLQLADAFSLTSRAFQFGPSVTIPIFRGGQLHGQLRLRRAEQQAAAYAFQRTVLQAWTDVDNALAAFTEAQNRRASIAAARAEALTALAAAGQRYTQGAADFLNVVTAEQQLMQTDNDLQRADTAIATDLVRLYRALGGGWHM